MRVALIGGSGLVGTTTAATLIRKGLNATVVSRTRPDGLPAGAAWCEADITDLRRIQTVLEHIAPDRVVHLASYLQFACEQNPQEAIRVNVQGTLNVLEVCRLGNIQRLVFGSSIAAYGERHDLMREDDPPPSRSSLYGLTKRFGEMLGRRHAAMHNLVFVALRYSGVFGPHDVHGHGMALVRQRIKETARGADVSVDASGEERIHLTHVSDAAEATCAALLHPRPSFDVYNVAGPDENYTDLRGLHDAVKSLRPKAGRVLWSGRGPTAGPVDTTRLREDLGVVPRVLLREGLARDLTG